MMSDLLRTPATGRDMAATAKKEEEVCQPVEAWCDRFKTVRTEFRDSIDGCLLTLCDLKGGGEHGMSVVGYLS